MPNISSTIYYNLNAPYSLTKGYRSTDHVTKVMEAIYDISLEETDIEILERIFQFLNLFEESSDTAIPKEYTVFNFCFHVDRSMSIGDVVEIDGKFYACNPTGWKLLEENDINPSKCEGCAEELG